MDESLLDTDILSEVLKQRNPVLRRNSARYLRAYGQFGFSAFTQFEISRGFKEKGATRLLTRFNSFCGNSLVLPVTDAVLERAGDLWVLARRGGHPHNDADLIIAATALEAGRTLITGNTPHFVWIPGLAVDDWRKR
jgi:tRNA(fMet)-specific endonuclease VapC